MGRPEPDSTSPAPHPDGLLWGVRVSSDGRTEPTTETEPPSAGWIWLHYDLLHGGTANGLARCALPDEARTLFTDPDEGARFQLEQGWVAGVLPDFEHGCDPHDIRTGAWRFFLTERRLVSARRTPLHGVHHVWRTLQTGQVPEHADALVQRMRRAFLDELTRLGGVLQQELDAVEDDLLETESAARRQARAGPQLGRVRQRIARLQRVTKPLARLEPEEEALPGWLDGAGFKSIQRRTLTVLDDLHAVQDRSQALQDELNARQNEDANRRLYVLAVVTSVLAPTTLVTGFFGMNTGGMPWTQLPHGTWLASALLISSVAAMVWLLRRGGLL